MLVWSVSLLCGEAEPGGPAELTGAGTADTTVAFALPEQEAGAAAAGAGATA